jgi:hypothetical protein
MKHLLFVAMPFGTKPDPSRRFDIDFDAIYERAVKPAASLADVQVVRADEETLGGIIHKLMYERLLLAEIVIADLTLANANVFYELGIRHAARPWSTILTYAKVGQLPFDVAPIRAIPYPLEPTGVLSDNEAQELKRQLSIRLEEAKSSQFTDSPLFQLLDSYTGVSLPHEATDAFRDRIEYVSDLTERMRQADALPSERHREALERIETEIGDFNSASHELPIDLLLAYRAASAWDKMVRTVEKMPDSLQRLPTVQQQLALALNRRDESGDREQAIHILRGVLREHGSSPETNALLGRVYKDIWCSARKLKQDAKARAALDEAITQYQTGFYADPRDYYPGVNLVMLLACRGREGDLNSLDQLRPVIEFAVARRGGVASDDYWDVAAVLELAAIGMDWHRAEDASARLRIISADPWMLDTTARNLELIRTAAAGDRACVAQLFPLAGRE